MSPERVRRALSSERGFTLVEVMVAALLTAMGTMALISVFDSSRELISTSEQVEVATHHGEREMERILALPYDEIALTTLPESSPTPTDPGYYVKPDGIYQWDQRSPGREDELVVDPAGELEPSTGWEDDSKTGGGDRLRGEIHRYVTSVTDPCCPGTVGAKRITVAVSLGGDASGKRPVLFSSIIEDPAETAP